MSESSDGWRKSYMNSIQSEHIYDNYYKILFEKQGILTYFNEIFGL